MEIENSLLVEADTLTPTDASLGGGSFRLSF